MVAIFKLIERFVKTTIFKLHFQTKTRHKNFSWTAPKFKRLYQGDLLEDCLKWINHVNKKTARQCDSFSETYLGPCPASMMELVCKNG